MCTDVLLRAVTQRPEGIKSSVTGVVDGCEPPCECWQLTQSSGQANIALNH